MGHETQQMHRTRGCSHHCQAITSTCRRAALQGHYRAGGVPELLEGQLALEALALSAHVQSAHVQSAPPYTQLQLQQSSGTCVMQPVSCLAAVPRSSCDPSLKSYVLCMKNKCAGMAAGYLALAAPDAQNEGHPAVAPKGPLVHQEVLGDVELHPNEVCESTVRY